MLNLSHLSLFFIILYIWITPSFALKQSYIVYMGDYSDEQQLSKDLLHNRTELHIDFLSSFVGSKKKAKEALFYSYRRHINGFAAVLDEEEANAIQQDPKVISVFLNEARIMHTTRSWEFLSLERNGKVPKDSLWRKAKFGEDIIIGTLDSGVWPESRSFSDEGYGPIPLKWKGTCEDDNGLPFPCNRKLIGAKYFNEGFLRTHRLEDRLRNTPRDYDGHGSHTLSTAGGNFVQGASVMGVYNGTAKGGAPRARVASYKVCWPLGDGKSTCSDADILKALDHAINDGVHVISVSLGGDTSRKYYKNAIAIGSFHAIRRGITVVASGGNDGPDAGTIGNVAPWIITVAASTLDRQIRAYVHLQNGVRLKGTSLSKPLPQGKFYSLISGANAKAKNANATEALLCKEGALDPKKVKGKILVCLGGDMSKSEKGDYAAEAGAAGMILCNSKNDAEDLSVDPQVLPSVQVGYTDGLAIFAYVNNIRNPMGLITPVEPVLNVKPSPIMASFSSRGPNTWTPEILKPDIAAPGVDVVAAYTEGKNVTESPSDERTTKYIFMSGTSMSCPHVSGIVSLLKAIHPKWSPAAIRSSLMTTATPLDNTGSPIINKPNDTANPFDYGSGHVRPDLAADPGLVYDMKPSHYTKFLCNLGYNQTLMTKFTKRYDLCYSEKRTSLLDLNYPSITVPKLSGSVTVRRILKNVGSPGIYIAKIREPFGVAVSVRPNIIDFTKIGKTKRFHLTMTRNTTTKENTYDFGEIVWSDGRHTVRSPIVVGSSRSPLSLTKQF